MLQGLVFENDDQVARLEVYRHDDKARPRVEVEVTVLASNATAKQEDLLFTTLGEDARSTVSPPPEPLERRLRRLARSAVVSNRESDEPPF